MYIEINITVFSLKASIENLIRGCVMIREHKTSFCLIDDNVNPWEGFLITMIPRFPGTVWCKNLHTPIKHIQIGQMLRNQNLINF